MDELTITQIVDELNTYFQNEQTDKEIGIAYHKQYGVSPVIYIDMSGTDRVLIGKYNGSWCLAIKSSGRYNFGDNAQKISDDIAIGQLENIMEAAEQRRAQAILDYLQNA